MAELEKNQQVTDDPYPAIKAMSEAIINIGKGQVYMDKRVQDIEIQVAQTLKLMSKILKELEKAEAEDE